MTLIPSLDGRSPQTCIMKTAIILACLLLSVLQIQARRGPHHPCGDVRRKNDQHHDHHHENHLMHDNEHMQEEIASSPQLVSSLNGKPVSKMSAEEKAFYFFKLHDLDNDNSLDGLELLQAAMHHHHKPPQTTGEPTASGLDITDDKMPFPNDILDVPSPATDELNDLQSQALDENDEDSLDHITDVIDDFIAHADIDHNGLLNFAEYTKATVRPHDDAASADIDSDHLDV